MNQLVVDYQSDIKSSKFAPLTRCWVCGGDRLYKLHQGRFDFEAYSEQDPELACYTGDKFWLKRCRACGFAQPEALPTLPRYFDRMYDQHWSDEWVAAEHEATYKDLIFDGILEFLSSRVHVRPRRLLDVGAHAGRFLVGGGARAEDAAHRDQWIRADPAAPAARRRGRRWRPAAADPGRGGPHDLLHRGAARADATPVRRAGRAAPRAGGSRRDRARGDR